MTTQDKEVPKDSGGEVQLPSTTKHGNDSVLGKNLKRSSDPPLPATPQRRRRQGSLESHYSRQRQLSAQRLRQQFMEPQDVDMMGPILRRKKVVSMPLGAGASDFFFSPVQPTRLPHQLDPPRSPRPENFSRKDGLRLSTGAETTTAKARRRHKTLSIDNLIARKQVSLDIQSPDHADFFRMPVLEDEEIIPLTTPAAEEQEPLTEEQEAEAKLFAPLRFSPPIKVGAGRGAHGAGHAPPPGQQQQGMIVDDEVKAAFERQTAHNRELKVQVAMLADRLQAAAAADEGENEKLLQDVHTTQNLIDCDTVVLQKKLFGGSEAVILEEEDSDEDENGVLLTPEDAGKENKDSIHDDSGIIKAGRLDYIWTGILIWVMIAFTAVVVGWHTEIDETFWTFGPVGLACATPCTGDLETQDYFHGHSHFETGEFIQFVMQLDPHPEAADVVLQLVGHETGSVKVELTMGPTNPDMPANFREKIEVTFDDPHEEHIINVTSSDPDIVITYKLNASKLSHLAKYSELIAALIMIFVYIFILLEIVHRTLVAIFGSLIALLFFFAIHQGETESISTVLLHMEWSTLGLLFGMMLIVGELSHTGVFEWISVRLLVASKGSYNRLMVLLCLLTAVASAFLDNVTTMLLVAPVTIDMCSILKVDPRPYLIAEVILSNVGGTATLIGDPPNIIIGSAFEEIGFVDFIVNILPCIFFIAIPVSVVLILRLYKYYMSYGKMADLDQEKLKRTYRIYDEPRLLIAGTVAFFVILIFFLHPLHHKDTAWIALLGAFITMTFTNPHDVQDALRNHVEWDTLLFFAGLFVLVEVCAALGLLAVIGEALASHIESQEEDKQLAIAITLILWVSAITSAFLDNIPYTATMIPVITILAEKLPETLPIEILAWALSFGACLGGNGTLLGASANIVTAGIATNRGFEISFLNFLYPGMVIMLVTVAIANLYMLVVYVWV